MSQSEGPALPAPRPLRVLVTTPRYFPYIGGIETHVYEVARRLARSGLDITVATTDPSGDLPPNEEVDGVRIRRVRAWPADRDYYFAPGIRTVIMGERWDLVHCQGYHTLMTPLSLVSAWRAGIPYVVTFHSGGNSSRLRSRLRGVQAAALRPLLARASALIGVSRFEADLFSRRLRIPRERFVVVPNGSNLPPIAQPVPTESDETLILSVGRLERYKGHHRVIAALPKVREQCPNVRLRIVGSGPYEAELRRLARDCGVADRVDVGPIPATDRAGMAELLSRAALVTLLSEYEAHSIAVIEALALERSVLVASTSGLREFAENGQARAIPLNSASDEVAAAIVRQLAEPTSPSHVELPSWEDCADAVFHVYQSVVRGATACAS